MKRRLRAYSSIVLILGSVVLLACGGGEYEAERMLWRADRLKKTIFETPVGTPPGLYLKAREAYQEILYRYPQSPVATGAQMAIGEIYTVEGRPLEAEEAFRKVIQKNPGKKEIEASATRAIAQLYEKEKRWEDAFELYKKIIQNYQDTLTALPVPIYLANHFKKENNPEEAKNYYKEALAYYARLEEKHPKSKIALGALELHFQCWAELGEWQEAIKTLQNICDQYPQTPEAAKAKALKVQIIKNLEKQVKNQSQVQPDPQSEPHTKTQAKSQPKPY